MGEVVDIREYRHRRERMNVRFRHATNELDRRVEQFLGTQTLTHNGTAVIGTATTSGVEGDTVFINLNGPKGAA